MLVISGDLRPGFVFRAHVRTEIAYTRCMRFCGLSNNHMNWMTGFGYVSAIVFYFCFVIPLINCQKLS